MAEPVDEELVNGVARLAPTAKPSRIRSVGPALLVVAIYALCAVFGFWQAWSQGPSHYATSGGGDQAASMWFLTWAPYSLLHWHAPLFSNYGNTPYGINMMVNTSTLPLGYVFMPVTLLWGAVVTFNLAFTLAPLLSACTAYLLIRRFTTWRPAAFVGGLLYGFSPYVVAAGVGHLMTVFVPLPPLVFLLLHDIVVRQRGRPVLRGIALGLILVVQFFISSEVFFGTVVMGTAAIVLTALFKHRDVRRHVPFAAASLGTGAVITAALLIYPIWFLLKGPAHVVGPIQQAPQVYRADLLGPLYPDVLQHFSPASLQHIANQFAGNGTENGSYLGLPLLLLFFVAGIALWKHIVVRISFLLALIAFVISLGSHLTVDNHATRIILPEGIFDKFPVLKNTVPVRFSLYVSLFVAIVLAIALERVHDSSIWGRSRALAAAVPGVVAVVVLLPLLPAWPYQMVDVSIPNYFTSGAARAIPPGDVVLMFPYPDETFANPQVWQSSIFLRFKLAGGRFNVPQPVTGVAGPARVSFTNTVLSAVAAGTPPAQTPELQRALRAQWRSWGVNDVIAFPYGPNTASELAFLTWALGRPPGHVADAFTWYRVR